MRQAKPVRPRKFGTAKKKPAPATIINVKGRAARHLLPTTLEPKVAQKVPGRPTVYSHRHYLGPIAWGLSVLVGGLIMRASHQRVAVDIVVALVYAGLMLGGSRHRHGFPRRWANLAASCTVVFLPLITAVGRVPAVLYLFTWAALFGWWAWAYRIRAPELPAGPTDDEKTWATLAEHKRWRGHLGKPEAIPNGIRYPLRLDGIHTHIGKVLADPLDIAAAWHRPVTEAYVEPSPDGVASRGFLTILRTGTLQTVRHWDGTGITPDGFGVVGRFADGANARIRTHARMDGARHSLIAGTTGAGKSELLNLLLHMYLTSGFIYPVVLDPQEGQSLPDWQGQVPYAAGADECMEMLELLHALMYARSRRLSKMNWDDDGHVRKMSFFDYELTGWPFVRIVADEAHILLTGDGRDARRAALAIALFKDIGKLGRKTGVGVDLVTQVPSLEELGSQVLRSMLRGGNVICLRTADKVSAGMLGLPADPHDLPQYFPNGEYTYGVGYLLGPDRRQAIARTDITTAQQRRLRYTLPTLDGDSQAILSRFGTTVRPDFASLNAMSGDDVLAGIEWAANRYRTPLVTVPPPDNSPAPGGQTATDAILAVLTRPMSRDEVLELVAQKAREWGRKPWSVRAVTGPLKTLVEQGRVLHPDERGPYSPAPRPVLTLAD